MTPELPSLPCAACLNDPACATTTDRMVAVYCVHHRVGLAHADGLFTMYAPVTREQYAAILAGVDLRREQIEASRPACERPN